jgi:hypothetical protein
MDSDGSARWDRRIDALLAIGSAAVIGYGVLVLGWSVFMVMALFWFENVAIGGFNVAKMLTTGVRTGIGGFAAALAIAAFFTLHYGLFTVVHGVFVVMLFGQPELGRGAMDGGPWGPVSALLSQLFTDRDGWYAIAAIVLVHAAGFAQWAWATREQPTPLKELMAAPYGRIVVLHLTLIVGGFLVMTLHAPVAGVLLLLALKLGYDLRTLGRNRRPGDAEDAAAHARRLPLAGRGNLP